MTSVIIPSEDEAVAKPANCGCKPMEEHSCRLDCLTAPRFFCGQMLTDQDMTALVDWTRDKLRLARYRHGWGVACGLEVKCSHKQNEHLIVSGGYAVSCCGDDIIVCEDVTVDLSKWCKPKPDVCAEFRPTETKQALIEIGCLRIPASELLVLDLYIHYDEQLGVPTTALGSGLCDHTAKCEYTRTIESYRFSLEESVDSADPLESAANTWLEGYGKCLGVLDAFSLKFPHYEKTPGMLKEVRDWLLAWIDAHPLTEFCFVRDCICATTEAPDQREIVRWLFWIVQDCRNAYLSCNCYGCESGHGVRLARVWLRVHEKPGAANARDCSILRVDPYPPYRRDLRPECWPAPLGSVNLGRLIWQHLAAAMSTASDLGIDVNATPRPLDLPSVTGELKPLLDCLPFVKFGDEPVLQYFDAGSKDFRVVGFCGKPVRAKHEEIVIHAAGANVAQPPSDIPAPAAEPVKDDLTRIPNIGPRREEQLNASGITSFRQIASMTPERLRESLPTLTEEPLKELIEAANRLTES